MTQSRLATAILALVIGCHAEASCGSKKLDTDKAEKVLTDALAKATGMTPTVTCPEDVDIKAGAIFQCEAKLGEAVGAFRVTQKDDKGNVSYELLQDFILSEKMEEGIARQIQETSGATATVNCGQRVRLSEPGTRFTCTADAKGQKLTVGVQIKDTKGNVHLEQLDSK